MISLQLPSIIGKQPKSHRNVTLDPETEKKQQNAGINTIYKPLQRVTLKTSYSSLGTVFLLQIIVSEDVLSLFF